jgi:hypothetical protein
MQTSESSLEALANRVAKLKHTLLTQRMRKVRGCVVLAITVLGYTLSTFSNTPLESVPLRGHPNPAI